MDKENLKFINSFSGWLSGIGTILAVIVALHLARRDKQIHLKVRASRGTIAGGPGVQTKDVIWVAVRNVGIRAARVDSIEWRIGFWRRTEFFQTQSADVESTTLPVRLADGDVARIVFSTATFTASNREKFREAINKRPFRWLALRSMRVVVHTSTGNYFKAFLQDSLRNYFRELCS